MPWKEVKPMDQKILFIADYLRGISTFSALCRDYCISRKTGYKWLTRYKSLGIDGLQDKSRQPYNCPHQIPHRVRRAIIETRKASRIAPGPKKIKVLLGQKYPALEIPSETSIYNILKKEGVIAPQKHRRRVVSAQQPFSPVQEPNDLWSADFKGQFKTKDGTWCYPLTVMKEIRDTPQLNLIHLFQHFPAATLGRTDTTQPAFLLKLFYIPLNGTAGDANMFGEFGNGQQIIPT